MKEHLSPENIEKLIASNVKCDKDFLELNTIFNICWSGQFLFAAAKYDQRVKWEPKERTPDEVRQDMLEAIAEMYVMCRVIEERYDVEDEPAYRKMITAVRFQMATAKEMYREVLIKRYRPQMDAWPSVEESFAQAVYDLINGGYDLGR